MSKKINGTFTLRQLLNLTYESREYKSRYEYAKRDVLKIIFVIKETTLHPDQNDAPTVSYVFKTFSYPQYKPYNNHTKTKQRKYKHEYDNILTIEADKNNKISLDTMNWTYRLGSQKKWDSKPPQSKIKSLYRETTEKWHDQYVIEVEKIKKKYSNKKDRDKALAKAKEEYNSKIEKHRKSAQYLDVGDYNSRVNGSNGDFVFRCQPTFAFFGHLYGRNTYPEGNVGEMFAPKHMIGLVDSLLKANIIKE